MVDDFLALILEKMTETYEWNPPEHNSGAPYEPPLFPIAQCLKGLKTYKGLDLDGATSITEKALAKAGLGWSSFSGIDGEEEGHYQFMKCYQAVQYPKGLGRLAYEVARALASGKSFVVIGERPGFAAAVNFCFWLQVVEGEGDIVLSSRDLAIVIGCKHATAAIYLRRMLDLGFLNRTKPADKGQRLAAEYRFIGELEPCGVLKPCRPTLAPSDGS